MMPLFARKPLRDLGRQKAKTLLILLSIIISLSIAGIILHTKLQFEAALKESMNQSHVSDAAFYTNSFQTLPARLHKLDGIKEAEAKISVRARAKTEEGFKNIEIAGLPDQQNYQIGQIHLYKNHPSDAASYAETTTLQLFQWKAGQNIELLIPGEKQKSLKLSGTVTDPSRIPAPFSGTGYLYLSSEALKKLGVPLTYTQILIEFEEGTSKEERDQLITRISKVLKSSGITSYRTEHAEETYYIRNTLVSAILTVLIWFGLFSLVLGFILITHLFHRVIAEHVKEMGIQRVVGAPLSFIWKQYFLYLGIIGSISFMCSAGVSYFGSKWAVRYLAEELNIGSYTETIHPLVAYLLLLLSFAIPYLGAFVPIQKVLNKPLTDTLRNVPHSFPSQKAKKSFGRFSLSVLSWRHAFSKKGQMVSNILMLSFGGAIIISCLALNQTLNSHLNQMNKFWNYDQEWSVKSKLPKSEMTALFKKTEGVSEAEGWTVRNTEIKLDKGGKHNALLMALPERSKLITPAVKEGQWLKRGGKPAIVINEDLRTMLGSPKPGEKAELQIGKERKTFYIEGIIGSQLRGPAAYMGGTDYEKWLLADTANRIAVKLTSGAKSGKVSEQLEKQLTDQGAAVEGTETIQAMQERPKQIIGLIVASILAAGILFTVLGLLNLMTATSMNVYERQKEIGITRAIGGSSGKILRMFAAESLIIAMISWSLAAAFSYPLSHFLCMQIGTALLGSPLQSGFYLDGIFIWLTASIVIGLGASAVPVIKSLAKPLPKMLED
ncbi:ABC transporter permease [Bacillus sp. SJS]|uniref:ABC transporter permease n=1 Tax=Bacillus sp. SJS TaxID=1423321 RepID=UPI0004DD04EC|nr:FtsX-like permease family protein [Bacillus sp. SJS]KZZ82586.1 hypothetical protein AS29_020485 [Bacillus sp. SJS]